MSRLLLQEGLQFAAGFLGVQASVLVAEDPAILVTDRAEMLMNMATGLHRQPSSMEHLASAVELYDRALGLCPRSARLLWARITARRATVLQALPGDVVMYLEAARESYQQALPIFAELGSPEEIAEVEMTHGLVLQALAGVQRARISDAIAELAAANRAQGEAIAATIRVTQEALRLIDAGRPQ